MSQVAIIGAGVAGSVLGVALAQRGVSCQLFERHQARRFGGGALILWSNALRALAHVGLCRDVMRLGQELSCTEFRDDQGRLLWRLHSRDVAPPGAPPSVVVPRAKLLALLDRSVGELRVEGELSRIEAREDSVRAHFEDGASADSEVLVGADGFRSTVRACLFGGLGPARATGQAIWVGVARAPHPLAPPGRAVAGVGRGQRFWYVAPGPDEVYWYATFPQHWQPADLNELARAYRGWYAPVSELIESTREPDVHKTLIADRAPSERWGRDRVTLLGDAIHPTTPDLGQGACQAIESAVTLAESLARSGARPSALRDYERQRRARAARVSNLSYLTAVGSANAAPAAVALRNWGIARLLPGLAVAELRQLLEGAPPR